MGHLIQCQCGSLKGELLNPKITHRVKCYCKDCQAFAHFLGKSSDVLDHQGGTDIVQTQPKNLTFSEGLENLACMKLSESGMLRWYASCCQTPIGNTMPNHKMAFVGLIHNCLEAHDSNLNDTFGQISCYVNTESALKAPKPESSGLLKTIAINLIRVFRDRLTGGFRQTPFFDIKSGRPITPPKVLNPQEKEMVMAQIEPMS